MDIKFPLYLFDLSIFDLRPGHESFLINIKNLIL